MKNDSPRIPLLVISVVIVLVLISMGQYGYSSRSLDGVREGFTGIEKVVRAPFVFVSNVWSNYIYLVDARQENEQLGKDLAEMEVQCMTLRELRAENSRLRDMLEFKKASRDFILLPAGLMTQDITLVFKSAIIDQGSRAGFVKDMPIVCPAGVVGRVISVSPHTSQVLLVTDPNSSIPAMLESSRVKGIVKGRGQGYMNFEYVRRTEEVSSGDYVVTSGLLGIFPKGLRIGAVTSVTRDEHKIFADISIDPCVDMNRIEEVFGIVNDVEKTD